MKATQVIRGALDGAQMWLLALVQDVKPDPLTPPTPRGGNHPLWVLGHVAFSEARIVAQYIEGAGSPLADWENLFGKGSAPGGDARRYPPVDAVLEQLQKVRAHTLDVLGRMTDDDLSRPSHAPADRAALFGTVAQCFSMISHHMVFHAGQVADARKAMGKPPVFG